MEEDTSLDSLKERKEKIINWLKKDYNLYFVGILVLALVIRLYYFSLTLDQPLWWDEAEYMNMARAWAFNLNYDFIPVRPVLFSIITAMAISGQPSLSKSAISRCACFRCSRSGVHDGNW